MRLFGLETEYGITREDHAEMDSVVESMELVRAHLSRAFQRTWDYSREDPHEDARGFRVSGLQQDKEEDAFSQVDAHRPFSFHEMKSDLVLPNGARFYNDHTHPEYSTPECRTLKTLIAHDRAGERILQRATARRNAALGGPHLQLYKNNSDFQGHSYGCHDNYLVARSIPFAALMSGLIPFLVSRQVFAGSGKVGIEGHGGTFQPGSFQLSQRADFIETECSVDTMHNRPILNTRDEPHADRRHYRRVHLIIGDANLCEYATALKVGTTRVVLDLIARGEAPIVELENPVWAVKEISRDPTLTVTVPRKSGGGLSGLDIQEHYLVAATRAFKGLDEDTDWVLHEWREVLTHLAGDCASLVGRVDWVTKRWLLETFVHEERIGWDDPWLTSLDLEYHNIDPARGLFLGVEQEGQAFRMTTEDDIQTAISQGPSDTRGGIRGLCIQRFPEQVESVQWEAVRFQGGGGSQTLDLGDLFEVEEVRALGEVLESAASPQEALTQWKQRKEQQPCNT